MSKGQGAGGREQKANAIDAQRTKNAERCTRMADGMEQRAEWARSETGKGNPTFCPEVYEKFIWDTISCSTCSKEGFSAARSPVATCLW